MFSDSRPRRDTTNCINARQGDTPLIKYLSIGIDKHYAITPLDGSGCGPWYAYNGYSLARLIYYYVLVSRDFSFVLKEINGRTVLEWMIHCTDYGLSGDSDDLLDYGINDNLLELENTKNYEHYVPSPNGERYWAYKAIAMLAKAAGKDYSRLLAKADLIKKLIKDKLWNKEEQWLCCLDKEGKRKTAYSIQIFDLLRTGVLDDEMEQGILTHLNEREFLSRHGVHSLAKTDPGYYAADMDWSGPGIYAGDVEIIEDLYKSNHPQAAEDILKRVLWWGERMPYYPQAIRADVIDYRRSSNEGINGRANCIAGPCAAQGIIWGMFGLEMHLSGEITINPRPPSLSKRIALKGLGVWNKKLDIEADRNSFSVKVDNKTIVSNIGKALTLNLFA